MKYRPKIGQGDFDTKTKKVEKFLGEGSKVKVTIMFRGREMQHPELGRRILDQVADVVDHLANVEFGPSLEGRNMIMVLGPDKKKIAVGFGTFNLGVQYASYDADNFSSDTDKLWLTLQFQISPKPLRDYLDGGGDGPS